jgi:hypothetical protein
VPVDNLTTDEEQIKEASKKDVFVISGGHVNYEGPDKIAEKR